jgi:hypothetical protein
MPMIRIRRIRTGYTVRLHEHETNVILKSQTVENLTQARRRAKLWSELYCQDDGTPCDIEEKTDE